MYWQGAIPGFEYNDDWWNKLYELFRTSFPDLPNGIARAAAKGVHWRAYSTPFVCFDGERPVSHVGVIEHRLLIHGVEHRFAGFHAVCTHPNYRRRGLTRKTLEQAIMWAETWTPWAKLSTSKPEVYHSNDFLVIPTHQLRTESRASITTSWRPLRAGSDPHDFALLDRLCQTRRPLSNAIINQDPGWLLQINLALQDRMDSAFRYIPEHDALVALRTLDSTCVIEEVLAPHDIPIEVIMGVADANPLNFSWRIPIDRMKKLDTSCHDEPTPPEDGVLMIRGHWPGPATLTLGPFWEH